MFVIGPAEASKEENWRQPANPEVLLGTESQNHGQHNPVEYCLLRLYRRAKHNKPWMAAKLNFIFVSQVLV